MSEGTGEIRWALEDEELEALMAGATPEDLDRVGNPIAEFFSDARSARSIGPPHPGPELQRLFASGAPVAPTINEPLSPLTDTTERPTVLQGSPSPGPTGPFVGGDVSGGRPRVETALPGEPPIMRPVRYEPAYTRTTVELIASVLRPTGTKLLMIAAVFALIVAAGPALGLFELGSGSGGVDNQAVATFETTLTTSVDTSATVATTESTTFRADAPVQTPETQVTVAPTTAPPATAAATAAPTTAAQTTTSATQPPTSATTTETSQTTTTIEETTTTIEPPTTVTRSQPTSTGDTTETSDTSESTTTTTPTTTTLTSVNLVPGLPYFVPGQRPAGNYRAPVPEGDGCLVRVFLGAGGETTYTAKAGEQITFPLAEGDTVVADVGCPTTYLVV